MTQSDGEDVACLRILPISFNNQSIKGTIRTTADQESGNSSSLCLSPFSISGFLSLLAVAGNNSGSSCVNARLNAPSTENDSNLAVFSFPPAESGLYAVYLSEGASDRNSSVIASLPLLVTEGQLLIEMPDRIRSDDQFISVGLKTSAPGNDSKFFAAVMMREADFQNATLSISKNDTKDCTDLVMSLSSRSMSIPCPFQLTSGLLMSMLPLLPESSAVGLQESSGLQASLMLMNDRPWQKGRYMVTGCVYSQERGLLGAEQRVVEVV
ncbi:MAG TPA: hypothetical protein PKK11_01985 [Methanothrix sp.]|nr:hypothetical protein [Methanothrix sp.]HPT19339.1 hypothetical protein [Methanothrix sp.]